MLKQKWFLIFSFIANIISAETINFAALIPGNTWIYSIDSSTGSAHYEWNWNSKGTLTISILDTICKNNMVIIHSKVNIKNAHHGYRGDSKCSCYLPDTIYKDTTYDVYDTLIMGALSDTLSNRYPFWNPLRMPSDSCIKAKYGTDTLFMYSRDGDSSWNGGSDSYSFNYSYVQNYGLISSVHMRGKYLLFNSRTWLTDSIRLISFTGNTLSVGNPNNKKSENRGINFSWQPSISRLNISFKGTTEDVWKVDIVDLQGRQIWHNQNRIVSNSELIIHPLHLSQSVYFLRIYNKKGISVHRITLH